MVNTLRGKVSLIYLCLVMMIAVVGAASVINLYRLSRAIDGLMTNNYKSINAVTNMLEASERQDSAVLIYINVDRQKGVDMFSQNGNEFLLWYNIEYNNITEPDERKYVDRVNSFYTEYTKMFSELQEIRNSQGTQKSIDFYNTKLMPNFINLKQELKKLSLLNEKAMFSSKDKATENAETSVYTILIMSTIAVAGGFILSRFFTNKFLMPLHNLTESVKLVKAGDLNQQIDITTQDETGELALEFNNMTKRLQQYEQSSLGKLLTEKNKSVAIVKSIYDPLVVLDNNYKILVLNNAFEKFFNVTEEKGVNRHFLEAVQNGEIFEHISSILESDEEPKEKIINIKEDYYFNVIVTKLRDIEANISGLIVVFQNVTGLKQLEQIRTDFIATISHEFKTPLTSIMMGASLIQNESVGTLSNKQKSIMNAIQEDGQRLTTLVNDLLQLSKIESKKALFQIQPSSIANIIDSSIKPLYELAEQKEVCLHFEADEDLPMVSADYEKITWVINNLITNAIKYTNAGDEIAVRAYEKNKRIYVSVKDTGIGIPPEYQDKIFDKFVQVKGQDLEVRGTGLGLAIVKDIIETHGGEIWCESKLDAGSNFIFTLPLSK